MNDEPVYDDAGNLIGYAVDGEDGDRLLHDGTGRITAGVDADLDPIDLTTYEPYVSGYGPYEPNPYAEYEERLAAAEQRASEPREVVVTRATAERDIETAMEDMSYQRDHAEDVEDRTYTLRERRMLASEMVADVDADQRPDIWQARERLEQRGENVYNLDQGSRGQRHEQRAAYMAERLADLERLDAQQRGEDDVSYPERPPQRADYNLDNRAERLAYLEDRARGVIGPEAGYSSSDYEEET